MLYQSYMKLCRTVGSLGSVKAPSIPWRIYRNGLNSSMQACASSTSYSNPTVYDIAFSFRDFEAEAAFLMEAHASVRQDPMKSFLEVGCGPARHTLLLAEAGIQECVGIDASSEMINYARETAQAMGLDDKVKFALADMTDPAGFHAALTEKVDGAAIMLGTLSHCLDNASAIQTLHNIAECVKVGGVLVVELGHPRDIFQGSFCSDGFVECWEVSESGEVDFAEDESDSEDDDQNEDPSPAKDELRVMVEYGREGDCFDVDRQILHRTVGMSLFDPDATLLSSNVETVQQRQFTLQEMDLLAKATGWEVASVWGDLSFDVPLDADEAYRMVVILKRN